MLWMVAGASTDTECLSAESSVDTFFAARDAYVQPYTTFFCFVIAL